MAEWKTQTGKVAGGSVYDLVEEIKDITLIDIGRIVGSQGERPIEEPEPVGVLWPHAGPQPSDIFGVLWVEGVEVNPGPMAHGQWAGQIREGQTCSDLALEDHRVFSGHRYVVRVVVGVAVQKKVQASASANVYQNHWRIVEPVGDHLDRRQEDRRPAFGAALSMIRYLHQ